MPAWFMRLTAPMYSAVLSVLIKRSLLSSHRPTQWSTAVTHPMAKMDSPGGPAYYGPISVSPVLSRAVERLIVHRHLYAAFAVQPLSQKPADQFAFRPTVSTTCALIAIFQHVSNLLKGCSYKFIYYHQHWVKSNGWK